MWEWAKVVHPEDRERVVQDWRDAIAAGRAPDNEMRVRGADGTYRWFLTRAVPLRDDNGSILRWYGTFTDIDARKRAEQELQKLKDQLQRENIALRDEISQTSMFEEIVGSSAPLRRVLVLVSRWRAPIRPSSSPARPAPGRSWSRAPFTGGPRGPRGRSCPSTAARFRRP